MLCLVSVNVKVIVMEELCGDVEVTISSTAMAMTAISPCSKRCRVGLLQCAALP